jgi:F-type H+-transporting ATPase subunit b
MDQTLIQLRGLLLGAIPTVIFLLVTYALYSILVHKPLVKVLAERRAKTEGAVEKARADVAAAEARTAEYEQRMREARVSVFKAQEARRQQANQVRAAAVAETKAKAQKQVDAARAVLEKEKSEAQSGLAAEAGKLATEMIRTVLSPAGVR